MRRAGRLDSYVADMAVYDEDDIRASSPRTAATATTVYEPVVAEGGRRVVAGGVRFGRTRPYAPGTSRRVKPARRDDDVVSNSTSSYSERPKGPCSSITTASCALDNDGRCREFTAYYIRRHDRGISPPSTNGRTT